MTYSEKIKGHRINENIIAFDQKIKEIDSLEQETSFEATDGIARVKSVMEGFVKSYNNCEKNLIAMNWIDSANNCIESVVSMLESFKSSFDQTIVCEQVNPQLDTLLDITAKMNCVRNRQSLNGVQNAFDKYIDSVKNENRKLKNECEKLRHEIIQIENNISNCDEEINRKENEFNNKIDAEKKRLDSFAEAYQNQRQQDQEKFNETINAWRVEFDTFRGDLASEKETLISENNEAFREYREQTEQIVGEINTSIFSHKYRETAETAKRRANKWQAITIFFIVGVIGFAIWVFSISLETDITWTGLVAKVVAAATLGTGAAYSARQASKHEKVERTAKRIEMELVSIDPYIKSLDDKTKAEIKTHLAYKLFGKDDIMELSSKEKNHEGYKSITKELLAKAATKTDEIS